MTRGQQLKVSVYDVTKGECAMVPLEDYMVQVLANEVQGDFHIEVLKAYAIMIRTYILRRMRLYDGEGCSHHPQADLCNDGDHCIGALPMEDIEPSKKEQLRHAIQESGEKVITYQGKLIIPYYHSTCGGATENSERVLGNTIQYARRVLCDYCHSDSPHWQSSVDFTIEELEERLGIHFPKFNPMKGATIHGMFYDTHRDAEGRILSLHIGDGHLKGSEVQKKLGLYSNRFGWQPTGIRFFVQGKGHGLGLCQYGAQGLAKRGKSCEEILRYYFTGIRVEKMPEWSIKKPLQGKIILIDPGHGGEDQGLKLNGWIEKDVNLRLSLLLETRLREAGARVEMTRRKDCYIPLSERVAVANRLPVNFFLSIHGNDNPAMGHITQIYVYPGDVEGKRMGECIAQGLRELKLSCRKPTEVALYLARESKKSTIILDIGYFFIRHFHTLETISDGIYQGLLSYWGIHQLLEDGG